MISLATAQCANYEACRRGIAPAAGPCAVCPAAQTLHKVHEPAADLGAKWARGILLNDGTLEEGSDAN